MESYILVFVQNFKFIDQFFLIIQRDALLLYHKFDYNLQKSTLIVGHNKQVSGELHISFRTKF